MHVGDSERFWAQTERRGDCVVWVGSTNAKGYGRFTSSRGRLFLAHRWAWEQHHGPVPDGREMDHLCRNRACVNVAHLEAVTHQTNLRRAPRNRPRIACPRGHLLRIAYVSPNGQMKCRLCRSIDARLRRRVSVWESPLKLCARHECRHAFKSLRVEQRCCSKRCGAILAQWERCGKAFVSDEVLGRPMPRGAVLYRTDNGSVVLCQDRSYRALLMSRMEVAACGGKPDSELKCARCERCKPTSEFNRLRTGRGYGAWCRDCSNAYCREYDKKRARGM
jgi:hypothetical protein